MFRAPVWQDAFIMTGHLPQGGTICLPARWPLLMSFRGPLMRNLVLAALLALPSTASTEVVGNVDVDWLGNDLVIEAMADPEVEGVTCHITYFERGIIDRLQKGNWFEDPSNSSISCRQTGPIKIGDIDRSDEGEDVFSERRSIIFKTLKVKRIFDEKNQTLIYISHARDVQNASAKMSLSTVPLYQP
jgi:CreA protein